MLASRSTQILNKPYFLNGYVGHLDKKSLGYTLMAYRKRFLETKKLKNGYKNDLHKGTPEKLEMHFAAFERKIKGKPLFNEVIKTDYLNGITVIFELFYDNISEEQGVCWREKEREKELNEWVTLYDEWNKNRPYRSRTECPIHIKKLTTEHKPGRLISIVEHGRNAYERKKINAPTI